MVGTTATESLPKHHQFLIGRNERRAGVAAGTSGVFEPTVGVIQRAGYVAGGAFITGGPRLLHCCVRNDGDAAFLLQVEQSANNNLANAPHGVTGVADAYADIPIRVDGADVANGELTVQPGAQAVFLIEWGLDLDDYLRFFIDNEAAVGEITVSHYEGLLVRREGVSVP